MAAARARARAAARAAARAKEMAAARATARAAARAKEMAAARPTARAAARARARATARGDCCHALPQISGKCTRIEYCSLGRVAHTSYEIYEYTAITQSHTHREFWGIALAPTCEGHLCFRLAENFYKPSTRACGILLCDHVWACEATPNILQIEIKKINAPPGTFPCGNHTTPSATVCAHR